jgi:hypothetical protein
MTKVIRLRFGSDYYALNLCFGSTKICRPSIMVPRLASALGKGIGDYGDNV